MLLEHVRDGVQALGDARKQAVHARQVVALVVAQQRLGARVLFGQQVGLVLGQNLKIGTRKDENKSPDCCTLKSE